MPKPVGSFLAVSLGVLTAACASILPQAGGQTAAVPVGPPADYRKLIRTEVPAALTKEAQVSELRKTVGPQPGDWIACLKSDTKPDAGAKPTSNFFAVFIEDGKVKDFRRSVLIDRCESASYAPLPPPEPVKPAPLKGKKPAPKNR